MDGFIIKGDGILPMDFDLLCNEKPNALYVDARRYGYRYGSCRGAFDSYEFKKICSHYLISKPIADTKRGISDWVRGFFQIEDAGKKRDIFYDSKNILLFPIYSRRILIKKPEIKNIVGNGYVPRKYWDMLSKEWENDKWAMLKIGRVPEFNGDIEQLCKELDDSHSYGFYVYYLDWTKTKVKDKSEMSPFAKAWLDINDGQAVLTQRTKNLKNR